MKIHFTKKEYRLLLDYLAIGQWVMHAYNVSSEGQESEHDQLNQKILNYAKEFGWENLVDYDASSKKYYPSQEYETGEKVTTFIEEYDEELFWDELCRRLAARDLLRKNGRAALEEMNWQERLTLEDEISEKYNDEFVENGLEHLVLNKKP